MKHTHENIVRIKAVYNLLGDLKDKVVFVGGATVSLYAQRETPEIRETKDVDILVEIASHHEYAAIEQKLRDMGFANDPEAKFVGRYLHQGLIVDVMATEESVLGFSNKWYKEGFKSAIDFRIDDLHVVKIFDAPHFIAAKVEAFKNRGNGDGRTSQDFEDIVFILENRQTIWEEMENAPEPVKSYLKEEFSVLRKNPHIEERIGSHAGFYTTTSAGLILQELDNYLSE
jgi:predicted nucleotidyltransferase